VIGLRGVTEMSGADESVVEVGEGVHLEAGVVVGHVRVVAVVVDLCSYEIDGMTAIQCALASEDVPLGLHHAQLQSDAHAEDYTFGFDRENLSRHDENVYVEYVAVARGMAILGDAVEAKKHHGWIYSAHTGR
jgi:hypothetical protein